MNSARPYSLRIRIASKWVAKVANSSSWPCATSTTETDSRRSSEFANNPLQQRDELSADPRRRFHDLGVVQRPRQHPGRHVRDARDPEDVDLHLPRRDRLVDR